MTKSVSQWLQKDNDLTWEVAGSQHGDGVAVAGLVDVLGEDLTVVPMRPAQLAVITKVVPSKCPEIEEQPNTRGTGHSVRVIGSQDIIVGFL